MGGLRELLACPVCGSVLAVGWQCRGCGACYTASNGIPNLRLGGDTRTEAVRRFYDRSQFPGYGPRDSLASLYARAERSKFARLLDEAIPGDARILEIGCGTGQMSLYLTRADRLVIGADLTRASLLLGQGAARRFGLARVQFVETDLRRPGLRAGAFDVVYASGVLHHTPNPRPSFARIAALARPGGRRQGRVPPARGRVAGRRHHFHPGAPRGAPGLVGPPLHAGLRHRTLHHGCGGTGDARTHRPGGCRTLARLSPPDRRRPETRDHPPGAAGSSRGRAGFWGRGADPARPPPAPPRTPSPGT